MRAKPEKTRVNVIKKFPDSHSNKDYALYLNSKEKEKINITRSNPHHIYVISMQNPNQLKKTIKLNSWKIYPTQIKKKKKRRSKN